jgi:hypothetical protein
MRQPTHQTGIALAIVVWFLAAMSLLVAGIVFQARVDTQMAQLHVAKAKATATGDGAIQLMVAALHSGELGRAEGRGSLRTDFEFGGERIAVQLVPVSGLVDLKQAPKKVLSQLFFIPGEVDEKAAQLTADSVIKWRNQSSSRARVGGKVARFSALEDLLRVEGVTRTHLDRLKDVVYVGKGGSTSPDLKSAPDALLKLTADNNQQAASILATRETQAAGGDRLRGSTNKKLTAGNIYRVDAVVSQGGLNWLRRRFVSMAPANSGRLPWRYFRTEPARVVATDQTIRERG